MKKRFLALFIAVLMLVSAIPYSASAESDGVPFTDVSDADWFYDSVKYTYAEGIFSGTDAEGKFFTPGRNMTRAELVMTLFKLSGANKADFEGDTGFVDVDAASWMGYAVKWAAHMGYVSGIGGGKFNPAGQITRQEFVAILYRYASDYYMTEAVDNSVFDGFKDNGAVADWAKASVAWAVDAAIISGIPDADSVPCITPTGTATRAQAARMLMVFSMMFDGADATGVVNKDLVFAVNNTTYTEPKNIIYMIGDGTGFNILEATENVYHDSLYNGKLAMNYIPQLHCQYTYSQNKTVTDSGAGGTALATGHKTANGFIARDYTSQTDFKTVLELAAEKGKDTGVVVTKSVTDATPASFTSHATNRGDTDEISDYQTNYLIDGTLDVLMGGGEEDFDSDYCLENGINYTNKKADLATAQTPFLGLFCYGNMDTTDPDMPTLPEMTAKALELLSADEDGFFLMIEGSQIDTKNHDNNFDAAVKEAYDFDCAVALAMQFVTENPDTVLIITADHETGGIIIPVEPTPENINETYYTTSEHTERSVPLYALGWGVEELTGFVENTDVAIFVAKLLGEENFGTRSEVKPLINETNRAALAGEYDFTQLTDNGVKISFTPENKYIEMPRDAFVTPIDEIKNCRAIHVELTNPGTEPTRLPFFGMEIEGDFFPSISQREWLMAGETLTLTYILDSSFWQDYMLGDVDFFTFGFGGEGYTTDLIVGDIYYTERGLAD